jgi:6-pyruvoyltetrahydropterin/6-carboxytetrahydropterin synthase
MVQITRRATFNSAHRLFRPEWDQEKNLEAFGKCSNELWHGHNYQLFVTIKGDINPLTGFLVNLKDLSRIMDEYVVEKLDHKNINLEVEFMKGKMASSENLAIAIWQQLEGPVRELGAELHCISLHETENNSVEYYGQ